MWCVDLRSLFSVNAYHSLISSSSGSGETGCLGFLLLHWLWKCVSGDLPQFKLWSLILLGINYPTGYYPAVDTLSAGTSSICWEMCHSCWSPCIYIKNRCTNKNTRHQERKHKGVRPFPEKCLLLSCSSSVVWLCLLFFIPRVEHTLCETLGLLPLDFLLCLFRVVCEVTTLCKLPRFKVLVSWNILLLLKKITFHSVVDYSCRAMLEIWLIGVPPHTSGKTQLDNVKKEPQLQTGAVLGTFSLMGSCCNHINKCQSCYEHIITIVNGDFYYR